MGSKCRYSSTNQFTSCGRLWPGELHPYSDVDLLILIDDSLSDRPLESISLFLTQLWDVGLEIGHSVRTLKECRELAEQDITIATNLLETRLLSGSPVLFESLRKSHRN